MVRSRSSKTCSPITVLLIDDSEGDRDTYTRYLRADPDYQYNVFSTDTLEDGMARWSVQSPDVVLLDINLPDGDGLEFLDFLQTESARKKLPARGELIVKVPVIVLTGQGNERMAVQSMKLGAADYLVKGDLTAASLRKSILTVVAYQTLARELIQSQQQKELLSEIALRVRQSLDLGQILQSAVDGVRQLLGCDRAVLYQFQPDWSGQVVVESVYTPSLSILNQEIIDPCFVNHWHEPYCQGRTSHVDDREDSSLTPCYAELLASIQVRANLVTPILQNERLWGLLIAHECHQPRSWQTSEIQWLQQLATQVSIAIQQALAYTQLQQLNQELEDRVARRTEALQQSEAQLRFQADILQDIHDAVISTDLDRVIVSWNQGAERIFGYQAAEAMGQNLATLCNSPDEFATVIVALLVHERYETELICRAKSGNLLYIHLRLSLRRDEQGNIVRIVGISNDITATKLSELARQQAEQESQLLRERLQFILSSNPAVLYTCAATGGFTTTFISDNLQTHFGYTPDELLLQSSFWLHCIHPDDRPQVLAQLSQVLQQGHQSLEYRFRHKNGEYRWVQNEIRLVGAAPGEAMELVGYFVDISDRHAIQAELQSLSDRLTLALKSAEIGTWDWDLIQKASWDDRMYTLYGLEFLQRPATYEDWLNALHPDDRNRTEQTFQQSLTLGKLDTEFRILLPNGAIRHIKAMGLMHYDHWGNPLRMVGINYDITAHKQAEADMLRYTQEVEDLYNNAPCGYHSLNLQGCYVRVNETELQWLGYTREEMLGQSFTQFLTPSSQQVFEQKYPTCLQQGWIKNQEYEMVCRDGSILPVLISATAVKDRDGNYLYNRATMLDIRDRKQFEQQLQQNNIELARATRLKDEFLANMSHELRTPLNAILGMSEALQEEILGTINERQKRAIATVESSGQHLLELINDILDLAKISAGKMELNPSPIAVFSLCKSSLLLVKQQALKKDIQLISLIAPDLDKILVDERRMRQVLVNLLTNAVKFTPKGGQITLEVKKQESEKPDDPVSWLLFSVTDTGIGIAEEDLPRLFQPFMQIDSSLNRQQPGTGLGLTMVKQITEMHGGWVSVASCLKQGSCFTVALPYQHLNANNPAGSIAETTPSEIEALSPTAVLQPCILLAEDNEANVATFTAYLNARNYRVIVAQNGTEAVALAQAEQPNLILMDIQMPGMDGLEAIKCIRADRRLADIPIIALTALAMPGDEERCIAIGANQYLSKPIKLRYLAEVIQQWL